MSVVRDSRPSMRSEKTLKSLKSEQENDHAPRQSLHSTVTVGTSKNDPETDATAEAVNQEPEDIQSDRKEKRSDPDDRPKSTWRCGVMIRCKRVTRFFWNSETREFLGRTWWRWLEIIVYYTLFYTALVAFWAGSVAFYYSTLSSERPRMIGKDSFLTSPALTYRPYNPNAKNIRLIDWRNTPDFDWVESIESTIRRMQGPYVNLTADPSWPCESCRSSTVWGTQPRTDSAVGHYNVTRDEDRRWRKETNVDCEERYYKGPECCGGKEICCPKDPACCNIQINKYDATSTLPNVSYCDKWKIDKNREMNNVNWLFDWTPPYEHLSKLPSCTPHVCLLLKLNRIYGFKPQGTWIDREDLCGNKLKKIKVAKIECELTDEKGMEFKSLQPDPKFHPPPILQYVPQQGFPVEDYPYEETKKSPFVFLKLDIAFSFCKILKLKCEMNDSNIEVVKGPNREDWLGYFEADVFYNPGVELYCRRWANCLWNDYSDWYKNNVLQKKGITYETKYKECVKERKDKFKEKCEDPGRRIKLDKSNDDIYLPD